MKKLIYLLILTFAFCNSFNVKSQTVIEIKPLFEYPVAPEEMESLEEKCNYLVKNFWNNFDFKNKQPIDQYALNEAFGVFVTPMRYASGKEVDQAVDKLIGKISGNTMLLLQFTKAAEENLYGPRAEFWSDGLYIKFLETILKNKKLADNRKMKYRNQLDALQNSAVDKTAPSFDFTAPNGDRKTYFPMSTPTLLIFGDPDDTDWRLARLKLDSNFKLGDAIDKGKINILYIVPGETQNWQQNVSNYNSKWTVGESSDITTKYDTRLNPSIYIVGSDGKITDKFPLIENAVETVLEMVN